MTFSAILIGNETLTHECGAMLLARGHTIVAVITRNAEVRRWAQAAGLTVAAAGDWGAIGQMTADWVLSIANLSIIPDPVLALGRKGAVNFHDGPLPAYAGLNAPVWALWNRETRHGISWHLITSGIDEGDILEQRQFDIAPNETALTLNTRCFEAALDSFPALIHQLENGLQAVPQDLSQRSHCARDARPAGFGHLDFTDRAELVAARVRALDHGQYWNPLCTAKIATRDRVYNVGQAEVCDGSGAPGSILSQSEDGLVVACSSGAVRLQRLTCQEKGGAISAVEITGPLNFDIDVASLTAHAARATNGEQRLRKALKSMDPVTIPGSVHASTADWQSLPMVGDLADLACAALHGLGLDQGDLACAVAGLPGYLSDWAPIRLATTDKVLASAATWPLDLMTRDRALAGITPPELGVSQTGPIRGTVITLSPTALYFDAARLPAPEAARLAARIAYLAPRISAWDASAVQPRMSQDEFDATVGALNATLAPRVDQCVHQAFEAQVTRTPDRTALICEDQELSYAQLNACANRAAHVLREMGVGPGVLVGLCTRRSLEMMIGALAIQKAGAAYVPMDPGYPADRIALFIEDSGCPVIVTQSGIDLHAHGARILELDRDPRIPEAPRDNPDGGASPGDLAYMIYTSGSTGRPKGVMVEHRNVANFFAGMDQRLGTEAGTWLAVTSMSFDISVLELFWTLSRGFKVVLSSDENRALVSAGPITLAQKMEFSLYYWGNDDGQSGDKYALLLDGARFADQNGFVAVWTPERHFHAFGGPYPNPAVTGAAVAAVTKNVAVRGGSCVVPLHHPMRVAEEWAVIDNLTNGRAGIAMASGWQPDDFILRPENTPPNNRDALFDGADKIRRLWRGEAVEFPRGDGSMFAARSQPRPISKELEMWITTAGNPATWREAGEIGAHVLTHLLGQTIEEVAGKIKIYHEALRKAGHNPADFKVTLMLHTFVGQDRETVRRVAEGPMKSYLAAAAGLVKQYAWAFPAFKKPAGLTNPMQIDLSSLSPEENEAILDYAFQRYFEDSGLFGTIDDALARVEELKRIGVSEVACLIDYGIANAVVMEGLVPLAEVLRRANAGGGIAPDDFSIAAQILRHGVTHLQCTPSMARMIGMDDDARGALAGVKTLMLGGEALPGALVRDLRQSSAARILNMYGPTETTIWSTTEEVGQAEPIQNIGTVLANQQVYVLDDAMMPVPPGVPGELWIGGDGVTRGYFQRPDLTADRFKDDPFVTPDRATPWGARMYRTGDLVRLRADGRLDYIGRTDFQVKLRGYRIELGEIDSVLAAQPGITGAVVMVREDIPGDLRLVAYLTGQITEPALRAALAKSLPDHMIPAHFVALAAFPLTPNRKTDRKALPAPTAAKPVETEAFMAPTSSIESDLAVIWARVLGLTKVGGRDNFFALGGHSLLAVQLHREIRQHMGATKLSITDIFRFPTLAALARHLEGAPKPVAAVPAAAPVGETADQRGDALARRLAMRARRQGQDA